VEETLTSAQVVQQKFDRAAANGEIVAIDWDVIVSVCRG
jgi:hypothetical protein